MPFTEELRSETEIEASPERVWRVLTAFDEFGSWNPFIVSIEGEPKVGARLTVRLQPPGGRGATLHPTVTVSEKDRSFGWLGHLGISGVFDGAHRFDLEPLPGGGTRFVQTEHFRGALVPLLRGWLRRSTLPGFEAMNGALAERVEAAA